MPWADRLWMVTYANRMIHPQSKQCIIGPHFIDARRNVRTCDAIKGHRVTADRPCTATAWFTYD